MCLSRFASTQTTDNRLTWSSGDWHADPDELPYCVHEWIILGKRKGARLVGVGDLFDLVLYPHDEYRYGNARAELIGLLSGYPFYYVDGNHDPESLIKKLKLPENIKVSKSLDIGSGPAMWHFEHGYQRALDWSILSKVTPAFTNFMLDHFPHVWHWICRRMGWIASGAKPELQGESTAYNVFIGTIHSAYIKYVESKRCSCVIGHTHAAFEAKAWKSTEAFQLLDAGNLREGGHVVIDQDGGRIEWLTR